jgi:membrane fusion protein (multidrug efflux system)
MYVVLANGDSMRILPIIIAAAVIALPTTAHTQGPPMEMPPPPVEVTTVHRAPLFNSISAIGSLTANESVTIRPEIAGLIKEFNFEEGQPVKAGQLLITLDQEILSAEVKRAKSSAALENANLERERKLKESGYTTQQSLDAARTAAVSNRADATVAQARLGKTAIRAPFDGVIGLRQIGLGDYVNVGQELVNLEQIDPLKLDFTVPEVFLASLRAGMPVEVRVDVYPGQVFTGEIYAINPKVDNVTRSVAARARVINPEGKLRPGIFARVSVPLPSAQTSLLVPETALVPMGAKVFAYRLKGDVAEQVEVTMGQRSNGMIEVPAGLNEGDTVVVTGQMRVQEGKPVNVVRTIAPPTQPVTDVVPTAVVPAADLQMQPAERLDNPATVTLDSPTPAEPAVENTVVE